MTKAKNYVWYNMNNVKKMLVNQPVILYGKTVDPCMGMLTEKAFVFDGGASVEMHQLGAAYSHWAYCDQILEAWKKPNFFLGFEPQKVKTSFIKQLFCCHTDKKLLGSFSGDQINLFGARSLWKCKDCEKEILMDKLD